MTTQSTQATGQKWLEFQGISLLSWRREDSNWPPEGMSFKKATEDQVCFVGDTLPKAYCDNIDEYRWANGGEGVQVIGSHRSKSCYLPVYGLDIPSLGVRAVLSNNFHVWSVSIELPRAVDLSMFKDRMSTEPCDPMYCYGFENRWVYNTPEHNPCVFTVQMGSRYDIYALFMSIAHQLRATK